MIYCFWLVITTVAFWIVRIDEIDELFEGLYQSGRWPVTIYPELAPREPHVPRPDRVRGHSAGAGADPG